MTPRLLQKARLMLPFRARMSKGPIRRGQQYILSEYILYASREACDLCRTEAKAERQVVIEVDGRAMHSGLVCLEDVSGITARQLELHVKGHLGLALRLRNLSDEGFQDEAAMLAHIEQLLGLLPEGGEYTSITAELRRLKAANHFTAPDLRWLEEVLDLLALLQMAERDPPAYQRMIEAVFEHPGRSAEEARSSLQVDRLSSPSKLSLTQAAELRKAMRALSELIPPLHFNPTIPPWEFPDCPTYLQAVAAHHQALADAGSTTQAGRLQLQFDLVHQGRRKPSIEDILTNLGIPCVLPVYEHAAIDALDLTGPRGLKLLEQGNNLPSGSLDSQVHISSASHQARVRTDPEHRRINNRGVTRPPDPGDTTDVTYHGVAFWRPDHWRPVYALWHEHGRERLLSFPQLAQRRSEES